MVDSSNIYFGKTYKDPYRWLENMKSPAVETWFKQEAELTNSVLRTIPGRDELIEEWKNLDKLEQPRYSNLVYRGGKVFYKKRMPGEDLAKVFFRKGINGPEQLLFDPARYIPGKKLSIQSILPSFDGTKVIIGYSENGAEISTLKIMDLASKSFSNETISPSWFGPIEWSFDNKSFTYFSQKTSDNTSPEFELNTKTKLHVLGTDVKNDIDYFSNESYPELKIQSNELPFVGENEDVKDYIIAYLGNVRNEIVAYYAPISEYRSPHIHWKILCKAEDQLVRSVVPVGEKIYGITYRDAKNFKLVATDMKNPDWAHARTVLPERQQTLEGVIYSKNYLFITYSDGINSHLFKMNTATEKIEEITLPYNGTVVVSVLDTKSNSCTVGITSWTKPYQEFEYEADKNTFTDGNFNKAATYPEPYNDLISEEVEVKGHDGVMIPLSIVRKKDVQLDGTNVCLMDGYGAYGISSTPYFGTRENALAVKGVVIAFAHIRGGSEKGQSWYKGGYKTTKPNTWKDFNSCAEYLIKNKYTAADRLAGTGTSAGGILISRAITERPDLYAAAICNVGMANAMRAEFTPNGPANVPEFGTVSDSIECRALYEMDGVAHVASGTKYPAVICVGGWNDPRVIAWQPGKFAAALQNASASGKPVLMKVNYDNGHFTEDRSVAHANFADQFAFAMWQCGHPDFQPKK
jgi:prolyl oligopeptidase